MAAPLLNNNRALVELIWGIRVAGTKFSGTLTHRAGAFPHSGNVCYVFSSRRADGGSAKRRFICKLSASARPLLFG